MRVLMHVLMHALVHVLITRLPSPRLFALGVRVRLALRYAVPLALLGQLAASARHAVMPNLQYTSRNALRYALLPQLSFTTNSTARCILHRDLDPDTAHQLGNSLRVALPDATWWAVRCITYLASHCALCLAVDQQIFRD